MAKGIEDWGHTNIYDIKNPDDFTKMLDKIPDSCKSSKKGEIIYDPTQNNSPISISATCGNIYFGQIHGVRFIANAQNLSELCEKMGVSQQTININCIKGPGGINDINNPNFRPKVHTVNDVNWLMHHREFIIKTQVIMFPNGNLIVSHISQGETSEYVPYTEA